MKKEIALVAAGISAGFAVGLRMHNQIVLYRMNVKPMEAIPYVRPLVEVLSDGKQIDPDVRIRPPCQCVEKEGEFIWECSCPRRELKTIRSGK